jgi:hypothetical protein
MTICDKNADNINTHLNQYEILFLISYIRRIAVGDLSFMAGILIMSCAVCSADA